MNASLYRADLHYPHLQLHTASSGSVPALESLYLCLRDRGLEGIGEVRINIAYLNGYSAQQVLDDVVAALGDWDLARPARTLLAALEQDHGHRLAPTRMLLDMALHDLVAKQVGTSVSGLLSAEPASPVMAHTNQTLFWTSEADFLRQAGDYVARGFTSLKVRIGIGTLQQDVDRLRALRSRFGDGVHLAADANGQWQPDHAADNLAALAPLRLGYLEQPLAPAYDDRLPALAAQSATPLMLDESVSHEADIDRVIALGGRVWAHLKLVKLGGIAPTVRAARRLRDAGVPFMIGQMNEGAAATAAALHVTHLTRPRFAELYGADGLGDDPVSGLRYQHGTVQCLSPLGLGVTFAAHQATLIQEFSHAKHR
ncbi:Mandelate racemase/muconate lactonizing protein [Sodalis praecaptivus]|uniref:Mandelate racemase/muconate lactonizing protein n=1 Tax=Sodalis praecaptivus TaxID=1239307 RepID=W0I0V2_9GAMM|nr:mandelate racemase/muconate lactonizing enzyme family protein [Sodalis praecaptivus]AHF78095.1 Mandelate racemase/muconate lactonizing protein [Sodalis praecaptivus]